MLTPPQLEYHPSSSHSLVRKCRLSEVPAPLHTLKLRPRSHTMRTASFPEPPAPRPSLYCCSNPLPHGGTRGRSISASNRWTDHRLQDQGFLQGTGCFSCRAQLQPPHCHILFLSCTLFRNQAIFLILICAWGQPLTLCGYLVTWPEVWSPKRLKRSVNTLENTRKFLSY